MDRMIYTALTGMDASMARQRAIANNLANVSTPGFRGESFAALSMRITGEQMEARSFAQGGVRGVDLTPGTIVQTGRSLDIAVNNDALIAFQGPEGGEVYSRRGDLAIGPAGTLENGDGLLVMGENGPITLPAGADISIGKDGHIFAGDPAAPEQPAEEVARIKLVGTEGSTILKGLDGHLRVPNDGVLPVDPTAEVTSGALEQSNVDSATALVEMIEAQRSFEMRAKLFSTARELDERGASLMSLNS